MPALRHGVSAGSFRGSRAAIYRSHIQVKPPAVPSRRTPDASSRELTPEVALRRTPGRELQASAAATVAPSAASTPQPTTTPSTQAVIVPGDFCEERWWASCLPLPGRRESALATVPGAWCTDCEGTPDLSDRGGDTVLLCPRYGSCDIGGAFGTSLRCAPGHTGAACAACQEGFKPEFDSPCAPCVACDMAADWTAAFVFSALGVAVVFFIVLAFVSTLTRGSLKSDMLIGSLRIATVYGSIMAMVIVATQPVKERTLNMHGRAVNLQSWQGGCGRTQPNQLQRGTQLLNEGYLGNLTSLVNGNASALDAAVVAAGGFGQPVTRWLSDASLYDRQELVDSANEWMVFVFTSAGVALGMVPPTSLSDRSCYFGHSAFVGTAQATMLISLLGGLTLVGMLIAVSYDCGVKAVKRGISEVRRRASSVSISPRGQGPHRAKSFGLRAPLNTAKPPPGPPARPPSPPGGDSLGGSNSGSDDMEGGGDSKNTPPVRGGVDSKAPSTTSVLSPLRGTLAAPSTHKSPTLQQSSSGSVAVGNPLHRATSSPTPPEAVTAIRKAPGPPPRGGLKGGARSPSIGQLRKQREQNKRLNAQVPLWRIFSWLGVRVAMSLYLYLWGAGVASAMQVRSQPLVVGTAGSFILPSALGVQSDSNGLSILAFLVLFVNAMLMPMAGIVFLRMSSSKLLDKSHHASVTWAVLTGGYRLQLAPRQVEKFAEFLLESLSTNQADTRSFELVRLMAVAMPVRVSRELEARCCGMARWLPSHGFALVQMLGQSAMLAALWLFEDIVTRIGLFAMVLLFLMGFLFALQPHTLGELDRLDMGTKGLCLLHLLAVALFGQNFVVSLMLVGLHGVTMLYLAYAISRGSCHCARASGARVVHGINACLPALKRGTSHDIDDSRLPSFWDLLRASILACSCGCINRNMCLRKCLASGLPNPRGVRVERPQPSRSGTAQWPYIVGVAIAMVQSRKMNAADAAAIEVELLKDARAVFALRHNFIDSATELFEALCPRCVRGSDSVYLPLEYAIEFSSNTIRAKPTFHANMDRRLGERLRATRDEVERSAANEGDSSGVMSSSGSFNSIRKSISAFTSSIRSNVATKKIQGTSGHSFAQRMSFGGSNDGKRSTSDMADFAAGVAHVSNTSLGERLQGVGGGRGSGNDRKRRGKNRRSAMGSVGGGGGGTEYASRMQAAAPTRRVEDEPIAESDSTEPRRQVRRHASPQSGPSRRPPVAKLQDDSPSAEAASLAQRIAELKDFAQGLQAISSEELHIMLSAALLPQSPEPLDTRGRKAVTAAAISGVPATKARQAAGHLRLGGAAADSNSAREDSSTSGSPQRDLPRHMVSSPSPHSLGESFTFGEVGEGGAGGVPLEFGAAGSTLMGDAGGAKSFKARRKSMLLSNSFAPQKAAAKGAVGGNGKLPGGSPGASTKGQGAQKTTTAPATSAAEADEQGIEMKSLEKVTRQIVKQTRRDSSTAQLGLAQARAEGHFGRKLAVDTAAQGAGGALSPARNSLRSGGSPSSGASASGALSFAAAGSSSELLRKGRRRRSSIMSNLTGAVKGALAKQIDPPSTSSEGGGSVRRMNPLQAASSTGATAGQGSKRDPAVTNPLAPVLAKRTSVAKKGPPPAPPLKQDGGGAVPGEGAPKRRTSALSTLEAIERLQNGHSSAAELEDAMRALRETAKVTQAAMGKSGGSPEDRNAKLARMRHVLEAASAQVPDK